MRNCRLCQGATKLLGLRLIGGNIRRDSAATMARTVGITKQATLKGLGIRRCISSLQNTEHFSSFHLEMESWVLPSLVPSCARKAFDHHSLAPLSHFTHLKSLMCYDSGRMLICQEKHTKGRSKPLHFMKEQ